MDLQGTESLVAQCVALRIRTELVAMDSLQFRKLATGRLNDTLATHGSNKS